MKKYIAIIVVIISLVANQATAQSVNLESTFSADTAKTQLSCQRVEVATKNFTLKYDYKVNGRDVLGIIVPKIYGDSTFNLSGVFVKLGDGGLKDQYVFGTWITKRFGKVKTLLELDRITSQTDKPWDCFGARISYSSFTAEFYAMALHPLVGQGLTKTDIYYRWIAFHPQHAFAAVGLLDKDYWGFVGTRNLKNFGTFSFFNYQTKTGNYWFKSQTAFGEINQDFFSLDNYLVATSYLVVPVFYYKHFSPICAKGEYSIKIEGRRTGNVSNFELMFGKSVANDFIRIAVGTNSEVKKNSIPDANAKTSVRIAPSFEAYKVWKFNGFKQTLELRYDVLIKTFSAYIITNF